jgi:ABC transporter substrate binding protein
MSGKIFLWLLATVLLTTTSPADAQQTGKMFRIGFLDASTASGSAGLLESFRQELSKLGWIEGKNITIEYRFAEQENERLPELAADLVRLKVDLIVVSSAVPALAVKKATTTIPIVMTHWGPRGPRSRSQSGAAGWQYHWVLGFSVRAKYQTARDTQGRSPQARPSWTATAAGSQHTKRPPTERAQDCGGGTEAKIGGDRHSSRR